MKSFVRNKVFWIFLLPSLIGMMLFYVIPYIASYYFATTDAVSGEFVGLSHYEAMLSNSSFQLAGWNTLIFMLICVPLNVALPFILAYLYHTSGRKGIYVLAFMLPLVIPSGATVYFWKVIFGSYGLINKLLVTNGMQPIPFFQSEISLYVVILVFMLKNIGFNMVLFITGLSFIPPEYYETAQVEGSTRWYAMRRITLVYIVPTAFMTLLMAIINSFKIFREIYLLLGEYPHTSVYMIQHYMNNLFSSAILQKLSAASTIISIVVAVVVISLYIGQRRIAQDL